MKECNLKKDKNLTKNKGLFAKMQKAVFWSVFLFFGGFVFSLCVFVLVFCKKAQETIFLQLRGFKILFPRKACL